MFVVEHYMYLRVQVTLRLSACHYKQLHQLFRTYSSKILINAFASSGGGKSAENSALFLLLIVLHLYQTIFIGLNLARAHVLQNFCCSMSYIHR